MKNYAVEIATKLEEYVYEAVVGACGGAPIVGLKRRQMRDTIATMVRSAIEAELNRQAAATAPEIAIDDMTEPELFDTLNRAVRAAIRELPPKSGVILYAFSPGAKLMQFATNCRREDAIAAVRNFIAQCDAEQIVDRR